MLAQSEAVNLAFSKQSDHYDDDDRSNIVLCDMRDQVYAHVRRFIRPSSQVLELNAGTGIDALKFASWGHSILATDLSDGMINQINRKIEKNQFSQRLSCQQLSYDKIDSLRGQQFDYVFSNFGGLNCIQDLRVVTRHLPGLLKPGSYCTWVIMPPVCLWEIIGTLKGNINSLRRLKKNGAFSQLEGQSFMTYYHSLSEIKRAFGTRFRLVAAEGLASLSPPPHRGDFPVRYPRTYRLLRKADRLVRGSYPFNRWADHIIVTFEFSK